MVDSSFILSPVSAEFSDVWSKPELLSAKGHNAIYIATRFGRRYILKALSERGDKVYTLSYLYCIRNDYYGGVLPSFCFIASFVLYVRFPAFSAGIFLSIPGSSDEPLLLSRSRR